MISVLKTKNRKPKRLLPVVLSVLIVSMCFSQIIPQTVEAAKKKPAVKSVVLKVNGKNATKKEVKVDRGSKVKVQVVVNPTKAKKSVKWSKLSAKQKKIATMKGNTITAKKNGTIKLTVKVKGKNGKTKSAWMKVKVVTPSKKKPATTTKPSTSTTKPSTTTPSKPSTSTPSTSNPSTPSTSQGTWKLRLRSFDSGDVLNKEFNVGQTVDISSYTDNLYSNAGMKFVGWYTGPNGTGSKVTSVTGEKGKTKSIYAYWVAKDASEWVFQNSSGSGDLVNKGEAYEADGIRTYSELGIDTTANIGWFTAQCTSCGKDISFNVNVKDINRTITVTKLIKVGNRIYAMSSAVEKANAVSADWMFIDITTAVDNLTYHDPCHTSLYSGFIAFSKAPHLSK